MKAFGCQSFWNTKFLFSASIQGSSHVACNLMWLCTPWGPHCTIHQTRSLCTMGIVTCKTMCLGGGGVWLQQHHNINHVHFQLVKFHTFLSFVPNVGINRNAIIMAMS
jgi:hypothetical protein